MITTNILLRALIGIFVTLGTTLITLFSGAEVQHFSDVTPVQYAVAAIGAVLAGLAVLQSAIADSPANIKQTNDIVKAAANLNQSGFVRLSILRALIVAAAIGLLTLSITGCATATPQKTITAASMTIEQMAVQIDQLQKAGSISNAREDALLDQLKAINGQLRLAASLTGESQMQSLTDINAQLVALRIELAKQERGK